MVKLSILWWKQKAPDWIEFAKVYIMYILQWKRRKPVNYRPDINNILEVMYSLMNKVIEWHHNLPLSRSSRSVQHLLSLRGSCIFTFLTFHFSTSSLANTSSPTYNDPYSAKADICWGPLSIEERNWNVPSFNAKAFSPRQTSPANGRLIAGEIEYESRFSLWIRNSRLLFKMVCRCFQIRLEKGLDGDQPNLCAVPSSFNCETPCRRSQFLMNSTV